MTIEQAEKRKQQTDQTVANIMAKLKPAPKNHEWFLGSRYMQQDVAQVQLVHNLLANISCAFLREGSPEITLDVVRGSTAGTIHHGLKIWESNQPWGDALDVTLQLRMAWFRMWRIDNKGREWASVTAKENPPQPAMEWQAMPWHDQTKPPEQVQGEVIDQSMEQDQVALVAKMYNAGVLTSAEAQEQIKAIVGVAMSAKDALTLKPQTTDPDKPPYLDPKTGEPMQATVTFPVLKPPAGQPPAEVWAMDAFQDEPEPDFANAASWDRAAIMAGKLPPGAVKAEHKFDHDNGSFCTVVTMKDGRQFNVTDNGAWALPATSAEYPPLDGVTFHDAVEQITKTALGFDVAAQINQQAQAHNASVEEREFEAKVQAQAGTLLEFKSKRAMSFDD